jgi:hypothetical protein
MDDWFKLIESRRSLSEDRLQELIFDKIICKELEIIFEILAKKYDWEIT